MTHSDRPTDRQRPSTPMPRWVKGFIVVGVIIVALLLVAVLSGHGPGRHMTDHAALSTPADSTADKR